MFKQLSIALATVTLVSACSSTTPEIQTGEDAAVIMDSLHKVDNSRTDLAYVDPNADFSKYQKIMLMPLGMDNVEIIQPDHNTSMSRSSRSNWELTDSDKEKLQKIFQESMTKELEKKYGYDVVTEAGDDG